MLGMFRAASFWKTVAAVSVLAAAASGLSAGDAMADSSDLPVGVSVGGAEMPHHPTGCTVVPFRDDAVAR